MNDHNLDDLIIDTIAPKNNKTKGFLTIVALFIVVLIVTIILTKTLLKSPESSELNFEDNLSEIIAPELKLQEPIKEIRIAKPKDELSLPSITEEKIKIFEDVKEPKITKDISRTDTEEKVVVTPVKSTIPVQKETPKPKVIKKPKIEIKRPVKKPTITPEVSKAPKTAISGRYYVQVGSFKENPSRRFLSVIKSSGFKYHVTSPDRTGYKKLLIGPYKTRADVDKARDIIRDRIHKSAFVVEK